MSCRGVHDDLAAYADQALAVAERERVARHLVDCTACRAELADILTVRTLVHRGCPQAVVDPALARRLVDIAGPEAGAHLWLARGTDARLPSPRRRRRRRLAMGVCATTAGVLGAFGSMMFVAPTLPVVADPDASSATDLPRAAGVAGPSVAASATTGVVPLAAANPCPAPLACPQEVLGLQRTMLAVASADRAEMVFGTGERQVVVVEQRGVLRGQPDVDPLTAHAWQSGEVVYCVIGADEQLTRQVVAALPHEPAAGQGAVNRARAGWRTLAGSRR